MSGIFISYRRSDSPDATGRIYDRLVGEFGKAQVFKDVDSIPLGRDFRGHLNDIVGNCGVMLAIVGPHWTEVRNPAGQRRLEDPEDFVRIELETALARDIPVVPVLVGHAPLPVASELPGSLGSLVFRQSIEVRPDPDFHNDATRLVTALRAILDPEAAAAEQAAAALAQAAAARSAQRARRLGWMLASVAIVAAVLGITAALLAVPAIRYLREKPPPAPPETRVDIVTPATSEPYSFALSPDGRQIVFVASGDGVSRLWLRSLASTTAQPLAGTEGATDPFWSPDSRSIGFFADRVLKRLDLGGGAPYTLAPADNEQGGTWNAAGVILFGPHPQSPVMRVSANGGAARAVTALKAGQSVQLAPFFLPDGHHFLFGVGGSSDAGGIYLGDLTGGAATRLTNTQSGPVYLPTGWMLWVRDGALVAQRLDVGKAALTGAPVTLAVGLPANGIPVSVSATGLVAYRVGAVSQSQLTWFDRSGTARGSVGAPDDALYQPRVAPDGRRVVVARGAVQSANLWLLDGARMSRLTFGASADFDPVWSPDGTRILFGSTSSSAFHLYQKLVNGSVGDEQPLLSSGQVKIPGVPTGWSPDGRFLLYRHTDPQTGGADLWVEPMIGAHTPSVFLKTPFDAGDGVFSPDGRWVAYQSNESGRFEIYVRPFHPPGTKDSDAASDAVQWQVSTVGGLYPTWQPNGKEIDYIDPSGAMMAAPITASGTTFAAGTPAKLFQTRILGGGEDVTGGREYDIAPDGRFLINTVSESATAPITLIQNWNPEATGVRRGDALLR